MNPTFTGAVHAGQLPWPMSAPGVTRTPDGFLLAGAGAVLVREQSIGVLTFETIIEQDDFPYTQPAAAATPTELWLAGGRPIDVRSPVDRIAAYSLESDDLGDEIGFFQLPEALSSATARIRNSILYVVGGQNSVGQATKSAFSAHISELLALLDDELDPDDPLAAPFVEHLLTKDTGIVPTSPGMAGCELVSVKRPGGRRIYVTGTGHHEPSYFTVIRGQLKMLIDQEVQLPYASRVGGACPLGPGLVYAGGTDGFNNPSSLVTTWDPSDGSMPAVSGAQLPYAVVEPVLLNFSGRVYLVGGNPASSGGGWGPHPTDECLHLQFS